MLVVTKWEPSERPSGWQWLDKVRFVLTADCWQLLDRCAHGSAAGPEAQDSLLQKGTELIILVKQAVTSAPHRATFVSVCGGLSEVWKDMYWVVSTVPLLWGVKREPKKRGKDGTPN